MIYVKTSERWLQTSQCCMLRSLKRLKLVINVVSGYLISLQSTVILKGIRVWLSFITIALLRYVQEKHLDLNRLFFVVFF